MAERATTIIVIGGGVFGVTAALELRRRGYTVSIFDPGPLPNPLASSTDVSKLIRMDYGADEFYISLMEPTLERWDSWNLFWGEKLYNQDGFLNLTCGEMRPGGFEYESFFQLKKRGYALERLNSETIGARFPAWSAKNYSDGYFNPRAGWSPSGRVTALLIEQARNEGVRIFEKRLFLRLLERGNRVIGIVTEDRQKHLADNVIVAAGAWTPVLLPQLSEEMWTTGQPLFFFKPPNPADYRPPGFPCWAADITRTGWYGFPALSDGTLKIGNHGPGRRLHPDDPREVTLGDVERCREFLSQTFPHLANVPLSGTRLCLYCDTWDGDFYIDHDPERPGLFVAAGDSGHGFKFAPVLGEIIADILERKPNPYASRFTWRSRGEPASEKARFTGE
jgi:sarcosine oxidase / L-pipecolate oxidase